MNALSATHLAAERILAEHPWCISPSHFRGLYAGIAAMLEGRSPVTDRREPIEATVFEMVSGRLSRASYSSAYRPSGKGGAALVIAVHGTLFPKGSNEFLRVLGGASLETIVSTMRQGARDPNISSIVLDIDSHGGMVQGVVEAAEAIRALTRIKHVTASVNYRAESGAFVLAAMCNEVIASPSATVGSLGLVSQYFSAAKALEDAGYVVQTLRYPDKKAEADGISPLTDEAVMFRMTQLRRAYDDIEGLVAFGRRKSREAIGACQQV